MHLSSQWWRMVVQVHLGKKWDPISKITKAERARGVDEVEHLPNMLKVLSSNSSTVKKDHGLKLAPGKNVSLYLKNK
jgi:hypothetical protein